MPPVFRRKGEYMRHLQIYFLTFLFLGCAALFADEPAKRIYVNRFDPADHPDHKRYAVTPPDWSVFGDETLFICCRGIDIKTDSKTGKRLGVNFDNTYKPFADAELGTILWPHQTGIQIDNLDELAEWVKEKGLFLFDFWGYVPGCGPFGAGDWIQNRPEQEKFDLLESVLGDHWLGMDNGEQDGRYVRLYASQMTPVTRCRFDQYLNFQRHFERLGNDLGNKLATLVSLNFGHYFLKEGLYTLIGAEAAQELPNSQVYYSWIRGAGKEYGVLWFGNASIYNRWGFKSYPDQIEDGTSLNLLKRLMYSHILYNSAAVGFENEWFCDGKLTPIGQIQRDAARWVKENGNPGTMITPVALLSDFFCGWSFPQCCYTPDVYLVWGNMPYDAGDYLNHNLLDLIYPGYELSSYYHDETGYLTPTPYGDGADSLLSDAPLWLLNRYPLVLIADRLTGGDPRRNKDGGKTEKNAELTEKLTAYAENGGRLVLTAGNLEALEGIFGLNVTGKRRFEAGTAVRFHDGTEVIEPHAFELLAVDLPERARLLAECDGMPAAFEFDWGTGSAVVLASPFGVALERAVSGKIKYNYDVPLPNPFPLLASAEKIYRDELDKTVLFDVGDGLGSISCRKGDKVWSVGIFNNGLSEKPFQIRSRIGKIASVRELPITTDERDEPGFLPKGFEGAELGSHTETTIAGADVRIFEVTLERENTAPIADLESPPAPKGKFLELRNPAVAKEEILARPTFWEHYDGITLDWRYINARCEEELTAEAGWFKRRGVRIAVDFSSGINLFPDLRLLNNDFEEYYRSISTMASVIDKSALLGAESILLSTHRTPDNNSSAEKNYRDSVITLRELAGLTAEKGMTPYLRVDLNQPLDDLELGKKYLTEIGKEELKLAPRLSILAENPETAEKLISDIGMVLVSGTISEEPNERIWSTDTPIGNGGKNAEARRFLDEHPDLAQIDTCGEF